MSQKQNLGLCICSYLCLTTEPQDQDYSSLLKCEGQTLKNIQKQNYIPILLVPICMP